jgi:cytochrome b561
MGPLLSQDGGINARVAGRIQEGRTMSLGGFVRARATEFSAETYDAGARLLHWLTVALLLTLLALGLTMTSLDPGKFQNTLFVWHESLGLTLFFLTLFRIGWRLSHSAPPASRDLSRLEVRASGTVHMLLYVSLLAMPITGYVFVVTGGFPLTYFGLANVPRLLAKHEGLWEIAETAHLSLQYVVYALVVMHAAAALHHHFFRRNDVLARMLPTLREHDSVTSRNHQK